VSERDYNEIQLIAADTPVTCARCGRTITMALDEWEEWIWLPGQVDTRMLAVCPEHATQAEREAHDSQPLQRAPLLAREARALAESPSRDDERLAEIVNELMDALEKLEAAEDI
jgi:hypothetical protein